MRVFLIRHLRPMIAEGLCYGRLDVAAEDPAAHAKRLRAQLPARTLVISSPLRRALDLARALDAKATVEPRLSEIDFGEWEGRPWADIERAALDAWAADVLHYTPPRGESVEALRRRAVSFAQSLAPLETPHVALITHAGVMRALIGHWRHLPVEEWTRLQFDFGSLRTVDIAV